MEISIFEFVFTIFVTIVATLVVVLLCSPGSTQTEETKSAGAGRAQRTAVDPKIQAGLDKLNPEEQAKAAEDIEREVVTAMGEQAKVKPRIVIIGQAGTGKSSIINAAFRIQVAKTDPARNTTKGIVEYPATRACPVHLYDSEGFNENAETNAKIKQALKDLVEARKAAVCKHTAKSAEGVGECVHAVWWVDDKRLPEKLFEFVKDVFGHDVPVFVVLNKCDARAEDVKERMRAAEEAYAKHGTVRIFPVVADPKAASGPFMMQCETCGSDKITVKSHAGVYTCDIETCAKFNDPTFFRHSHGIDKLLSATYEVLPDLLKKAFLLAQNDWLDGKHHSAHFIVLGCTSIAGGIGASPIPFSDFPLLVANQVVMGKLLSDHYEVVLAEGTVKQLMATMMSTTVLAGLGLMLGSGLKLIPGFGTAAGIATDVAIASAFTFALGELMSQLFYVAKKNCITELDYETMKKLMPIDEQAAMFKRVFGERFFGDKSRAERPPA